MICPYCGCSKFTEKEDKIPTNMSLLLFKTEDGHQYITKCIGCRYSIVKFYEHKDFNAKPD